MSHSDSSSPRSTNLIKAIGKSLRSRSALKKTVTPPVTITVDQLVANYYQPILKTLLPPIMQSLNVKGIDCSTHFNLSEVLNSNESVIDTLYCTRAVKNMDASLMQKFALFCAMGALANIPVPQANAVIESLQILRDYLYGSATRYDLLQVEDKLEQLANKYQHAANLTGGECGYRSSEYDVASRTHTATMCALYAFFTTTFDAVPEDSNSYLQKTYDESMKSFSNDKKYLAIKGICRNTYKAKLKAVLDAGEWV
jgi:hypothetical protein